MDFNRTSRRSASLVLVCTVIGLNCDMDGASAFSPTAPLSKNIRLRPRLFSGNVGQEPKTATLKVEETEDQISQSSLPELPEESMPTVASLVGSVDEQRIVFPELSSGEVPRVFSSLVYTKSDDGKLSATHAAGSTLGATALVAGTTVGAGILALPSATVGSGFIPSTLGMTVAWVFMTMSGLMIAELSINRFGETGKPGLGLLDLYESSLGKTWGRVGSAVYIFFQYAVMVAFVAQGGNNLDDLLSSVGLESVASIPGFGQLMFVGIGGLALYTAKQTLVEQVNNVLVLGVFTCFLGILSIGAGSADFEALMSSANQHPEAIANAFPILFLSFVYQNIVPTVVAQLEGDRSKITSAITIGTALPFIMFVTWNAIILGNVLGLDAPSGVDPISVLQSGSGGGETLSTLVGGFSELALITSVIGFVYGLVDAWTDITGLPSEGPKFEKWKPVLFAAVLLPPLALSASNPEIFKVALDYGGAFGVSTLFLVLPPIMVWKSRYGKGSPLLTKPMVPLGKIPLVAMLATSGALIIQQADEKFGISSFVQDQILS